MNPLELVLIAAIVVAFVAGTWAVALITLDQARSRRRFALDRATQRRVSAALAPTREIGR